jgi:hypothetical protein
VKHSELNANSEKQKANRQTLKAKSEKQIAKSKKQKANRQTLMAKNEK